MPLISIDVSRDESFAIQIIPRHLPHWAGAHDHQAGHQAEGRLHAARDKLGFRRLGRISRSRLRFLVADRQIHSWLAEDLGEPEGQQAGNDADEDAANDQISDHFRLSQTLTGRLPRPASSLSKKTQPAGQRAASELGDFSAP